MDLLSAERANVWGVLYMRKSVALFVLLLLALLLSGCVERTFSAKTVIEWSRGRRLGTVPADSSEPLALTVEPNGEWTALAWVSSPERGTHALHLAVLAANGAVLTDVDLPFEVREPRGLVLEPAGDGELHLLWLDAAEHIHSLFYARVTLTGQVAEPVRQLSAEGYRVNGHDAAILPSGELLVVWSNREGLRAARLKGDGIQTLATLEAPNAGPLALQVDDDGLAHIAWQQSFRANERRLYYTSLEPATLTLDWPMYLSTVILQGGGSLQGSPEGLWGPLLALEEGQVTVVWLVGRGESGQSRGYFATFVPREVRELLPRRLAVPARYQPNYAPASGSLPYRQLALSLPFDKASSGTPLHTLPATTEGQVQEIPLAASLLLRTRWSPQIQPALLVLKEGKLKGFQVVAWTRHPSLHPSLAEDAEGNLYYAWLDAEGNASAVYLATTAPALKAAWDRLERDDLRVALERLSGRAISAVALIVIALSWLILPGFLLILALFVFREDSLLTVRGKVVFLILIGAHWVGKYLVAPDVLTMLPKMSELPLIFPLLPVLAPGVFAYLPNQLHLPPFVALWIPYLIPSLTLLAGVLVMRLLYLRRSRHPNLVLAYLIVAVIDLFLAMQIYALTYHDPIKF